MTKKLLALLAAVLLLCTACTEPAAAPQPAEPPQAADPTAPLTEFNDTEFLFRSDDIFTHMTVEDGRIPLVVGTAGNLGSVTAINARFAELHPECVIITNDVTCGAGNVAVNERLARGRAGDVLFVQNQSLIWSETTQYLTDLSSNPVTASYLTSALRGLDADGRLYALPGPSQATVIAYNKTMFEEHGWAVPATFDELVELCVRIETETEGAVDALNPNAKYAQVFLTLLQMCTYSETLASIEDRTWLESVLTGDGVLTGHIEPLFEAAKKLIDAGLLSEDYWTFSATTRRNEFFEGKIAMINMPANDGMRNSDFEVAYMPFPGETAEDAYVQTEASYVLAVPLQTGISPEKQALIQEYIEFASTPEAQSLFMGGAMMLPSVRDLDIPEGNTLIQEVISRGQAVPQEDFKGANSPYMLEAFSAAILKMLLGETDIAGAVAMCDKTLASARAAGGEAADARPVLGVAADDFTVLETSEFFCDMFRAETDADIALVLNNCVLRGNVMPIYAGDMTDRHITSLLPRSLGNGSMLSLVKMTGASLLECLAHPYDPNTEGDANCVYAASGLKMTVAPWNAEGERVLSATLEDGSPIDPAAEYTVAVWQGTVHPEYIAEELSTVEKGFVDMLTAYLGGNTISPAPLRMTLVWP